MLALCNTLTRLTRRHRFAAAVAVFTLLVGGASLVAQPVFRAADAEESQSPTERSEETSIVARFVRVSMHRSACSNSTFAHLMRPNFSRAQRPTIETHSGHRLANGLLAPMTC